MPTRHRLIALTLAATLSSGMLGCGQAAPGFGTARTTASASAKSAEANRAQFYEELMSQVDKNHNGALDRPETQDTWLSSDFDRLDADHDAKLSRGELDAFFFSPSQAEVKSVGGVAGIGAGVAAVGLAAYMAYAGMVGSRDLMFPHKDDYRKDPSAYSIPYEKVTFQSHDGLKLAGWYVPAAHPTTKGLLVLHGHGSNKDVVFHKYGNWLHADYNLFLYDQRYSGDSEGPYCTLGYLERRDAVIALDQLRQHGNTTIGIMGESMGGAVAINAAAVTPDVKCVVSDAAFDSFVDAIGPRAAAKKYPLSGLVAQAVTKTVALRVHGDVADSDPIKWVAKISPRPFFLIHGDQDDETTPMNGEKLFAAAKEPKQSWFSPGSKHCTSWKDHPEEYKQKVLSFLEKSL